MVPENPRILSVLIGIKISPTPSDLSGFQIYRLSRWLAVNLVLITVDEAERWGGCKKKKKVVIVNQ